MRLHVTTIEQDRAARAAFERVRAEDEALIAQGEALLNCVLSSTVREVRPMPVRRREPEFSK